jgi:hypothetical protein
MRVHFEYEVRSTFELGCAVAPHPTLPEYR